VLQSSIAEIQTWFDSRQAQGGSRPDPRLVTLQVLEERRLVAHRRPHDFDNRPGGIINGPALMGFIDAAGWMFAVAHQPPGSDAFTMDISMQFLRGAPVGELLVEVLALRVGGRTAVLDATVTSPSVPEGPVAHAVVTFVTPRRS
jgi:acyl-coenzyme A thioesterase PaaI-like protein